MSDCILVDLDGTLADISHRLHHVKGDKKDFDSFFAEVGQDSPKTNVIDVVNRLSHEDTIIIVSGRSDVCRQETIDWLARHGVVYDHLEMRREGDTRQDTFVKEEMLDDLEAEGLCPWLAIDDRGRLAKMWRSHNILTFQVDDWEEREAEYAPSQGDVTLYVMVGPSGAGKTSVYRSVAPTAYRVSSDELREAACRGDMEDQSRNNNVFKAAHGMTRSLLLNGIDVVFDATNIKDKDRKAVVELAPPGTDIKYVVLNRPMQDKKTTAEWHPHWLLEKHEQTFKSNLKAILDGDGFDNVTVIDHRHPESCNSTDSRRRWNQNLPEGNE